MAGIKELRQRIKSVGNIKQITRAMEMVASTKLRRFQDRAIASRPYSEEIAGLVARMSAAVGDSLEDTTLFEPGEGDRTLVLLMSSDRGLCGAYNTQLFRALEEWLVDRDVSKHDFYVYGRKGAQYLSKRGRNVERFLTDPPMEQVDYANATTTGRMLVREFESGTYRDVYLVSTSFETMVRYVPRVVPFLPLSPDAIGGGEDRAPASDAIMEPNAQAIFEAIVPRYLETRIYNALLESLTSEYASRRFAMKNATDAADDMVKVLKSIYNRKRQEGITKELLDIVGGTEALK
ncbi:MAG: ATP synthase F1 subunit gamma [Planctomycetota bacterium]